MSVIDSPEFQASLDKLDNECLALYLEVPGSQIVLLQAYFELHEGVAITRTISVARSLICLLTTPSMLNDCLAILASIRHNIEWRFVQKPSEADRELFHGYSRKGKML